MSSASNSPDHLLEPLRGLGLRLNSLEELGLTQEGHRVSFPSVGWFGEAGSSIWLDPVALKDFNFAAGYGCANVRIHYPVLAEPCLFLCEHLVDALLLKQAIRQGGFGGACTVAVASIWESIPAEWEEAAWWAQWSSIQVFGRSQFTFRIQSMAGRHVINRSRLFGGAPGLPESVAAIHHWLTSLGTTHEDASSDASSQVPALTPYRPVDIHGAFVNGHLYYVLPMVQRLAAIEAGHEQPVFVERRIIKVVKSDGSLQEILPSLAPDGTSKENQLFRLTDGTLVFPPSIPKTCNMWSLESIMAFHAGRAQVRLLKDLLTDLVEVLTSSVWLPHPEDYSVLALCVVVTYLQEVFDAVPLILTVGPKDTGKSTLGIAMAALAANADILGVVSPATLTRRIDECRGLVVLDDLEKIAGKNRHDIYSEIVQILKVSYKKKTARRAITIGNSTVVLNFFGIKIINNTRGADDFINSRSLRIRTAAMPSGVELPSSAVSTDRLRDELFVWAFSNVLKVAAGYAAVPAASREEEITAPLRVLARLSDDPDYERKLDEHLQRPCQQTTPDLGSALRMAMEKMALTESHVFPSLLCAELEEEIRQAGGTVPPHLNPEWVGVQLRLTGYVATEARAVRVRKNGKFLRKYALSRVDER